MLAYDVYYGYNGYGFSFKPFKAIKRALPKSIRRIKPAKFIKRATGSKKITSALLKIGGLTAAVGTGYALAMNPSISAPLSSTISKVAGSALTLGKTVGSTIIETAKPIVKEIAPAVVSSVVYPQKTAQYPTGVDVISDIGTSYSIPVPYPTGKSAETYWLTQTYKNKSELEEYLPLIALGGGILLLAIILKR